jgi:LmbE family N-acetylglucosaminyl deacetylase
MKVFDPDPRLRWLFCMTHPDDELAICGWIRRLAALGAEVHLSWTHSDPEREDEARRAAALLDVAPNRLHFHRGPDRRLEAQMAEILPSFRAMFEALKPDRVVAGAFEQGHLDHDATNFLVHRCFSGPVLEVPLYHAYCQPIPTLNRFATPGGEEVLELLPYELELKRKLAQCYPSQAIWGNLVWYRLLQRLRLEKEALGSVERMRVQTHVDFLTPNLPPKLAAQVVKTIRWKRWTAAVHAFAEPTRSAA